MSTTHRLPQPETSHQPAAAPVGPPSRHQMAILIWIAVFPTLSVVSTVLGPWIGDLNPVVRTFVLATIAVPTIVYGEMPWLQRARIWILTRRAA